MSNVELKYLTRYGEEMTSEEAAYEMLDRITNRLDFLTHVFSNLHGEGEGFTMPGYMTKGLSCILEGIMTDVWEVQTYVYGDNATPGRNYENAFTTLQAAKKKGEGRQ